MRSFLVDKTKRQTMLRIMPNPSNLIQTQFLYADGRFEVYFDSTKEIVDDPAAGGGGGER